MKLFKVKLVVLSLFVAVLGACGIGATLPPKTAENGQVGVIAIPKSLKVKAGAPIGTTAYAIQVEISDAKKKPLPQLVTLQIQAGRQFKFVQDLTPGTYYFTGFRFAAVNRTSVQGNSDSEMVRFGDTEYPITVEAGTVTVMPLLFHIERDSTGHNSWKTSPKFQDLVGEELEIFTAKLEGMNAGGQWQLSWPSPWR